MDGAPGVEVASTSTVGPHRLEKHGRPLSAWQGSVEVLIDKALRLFAAGLLSREECYALLGELDALSRSQHPPDR
jgi:hypothetical protein